MHGESPQTRIFHWHSFEPQRSLNSGGTSEQSICKKSKIKMKPVQQTEHTLPHVPPPSEPLPPPPPRTEQLRTFPQAYFRDFPSSPPPFTSSQQLLSMLKSTLGTCAAPPPLPPPRPLFQLWPALQSPWGSITSLPAATPALLPPASSIAPVFPQGSPIVPYAAQVRRGRGPGKRGPGKNRRTKIIQIFFTKDGSSLTKNIAIDSYAINTVTSEEVDIEKNIKERLWCADKHGSVKEAQTGIPLQKYILIWQGYSPGEGLNNGSTQEYSGLKYTYYTLSDILSRSEIQLNSLSKLEHGIAPPVSASLRTETSTSSSVTPGRTPTTAAPGLPR